MRYDLELIQTLCSELGLPIRLTTDQAEIDLGHGAVLCFKNVERDADCLIGFLGVAWHTHDDLMFVDGRGNSVELDYLDLLTGLRDGRVLIAEREIGAVVADRWLIHSQYNDEFKYLEPGERIIIRRATFTPA